MKGSRFLSILIFCFAAVTMSAQSGADSKQKDNDNNVGIEKFSIASDSLGNIEDGYKLLKEVNYNDSIKPFVTVEQMPSFPGGESEMHKFISNNLRYPTEPQEEGICSRFTARFVIREDGSITNIQMMRSCSETLDNEVVKMIKMMPKWIPGRQNGKAVPVYFTLGMHIRLKN